MSAPSQARSRASLSVRPMRWPPVGDLVVVGTEAPVGPVALERALALVVAERYRVLPWPGPPVEAVLVREALLSWWPEAALRAELDRVIAGRMHPRDLLDLNVELEVSFRD